MEQLFITSLDNTQVPVYWVQAKSASSAILMLPALGVQAKLYLKLAEKLADSGTSVLVMEQRGHGLSAPPPSRQNSHGMEDILDSDMPALLAWLKEKEPGVPLLLAGHSLGGHWSTIFAGQHPREIAGVIHLACGFPYYGDFPPSEARKLRLIRKLMPVFGLLPGYYPGHRIGFGGRESIRMMTQWCQWAGTGRFDFDQHQNLAEKVAGFSGPLLSIAFERDDFVPEAARARAMSPFVNSDVSRVKLGEADQGDYLGHTRWARSPEGVVVVVRDWISEKF